MSKQRKFRVSVFPPGTTNLGDNPLHHHACQSRRTAEEHFLKYVTQADKPRVIVHQGNLRGHAFKRILDSYWGEHYGDPGKSWRDYIANDGRNRKHNGRLDKS